MSMSCNVVVFYNFYFSDHVIHLYGIGVVLPGLIPLDIYHLSLAMRLHRGFNLAIAKSVENSYQSPLMICLHLI